MWVCPLPLTEWFCLDERSLWSLTLWLYLTFNNQISESKFNSLYYCCCCSIRGNASHWSICTPRYPLVGQFINLKSMLRSKIVLGNVKHWLGISPPPPAIVRLFSPILTLFGLFSPSIWPLSHSADNVWLHHNYRIKAMGFVDVGRVQNNQNIFHWKYVEKPQCW